MSGKRHTTKQQFSALMEFMKENEMIARGLVNVPEYRTDIERLWEGVTETLNALGPSIKTAIAWKKVWKDLKYHTKNKVRQNLVNRHKKGIDGQCKQLAMSSIEKDIIALLDLNTSEIKKVINVPPSINLNDLLVDITQGSTNSLEEAANVLESENKSQLQQQMRQSPKIPENPLKVQCQKSNRYILHKIKLLEKQNKLLEKQSKLVLKKWTHMRDSWTKSVKKKESNKPSRPYLYHEDMSFLRQDNTNELSKRDKSTDNENDESSDDENSMNKTEEQSSSSKPSGISGVKRKHLNVNEANKEPEKKRQKFNVSSQDDNGNRHLLFFRGLLPSLALLNDDQTLEFQSGVITLLQKIKNNSQTHFVEFPQTQQLNAYSWHESDNLDEAPTIKYCNTDDDSNN